MAQNYEAWYYDSTSNGREDLQIIENNFECLRSFFSGTSAPSDYVAGQVWFDISTDTEILKLRNYNNTSWIGIMTGDETHKMWVYSNSAKNGWTLSPTPPEDCILSLKGGSQSYNISGGYNGGSWTQPSHALTTSQIPAHTHGSAGNHTHGLPTITGIRDGYGAGLLYNTPVVSNRDISTAGAHTHSSVGSNTEHNHGSTYRPYAAVGTMQNLNI